MKKTVFIIVCSGLFLFITGLSSADEGKKGTVQLSEEPRRRAGLNLPYGIVGALPRAELLRKKGNLEGIEYFTGFGWGKLKAKRSYHLTPFLVDFDFNLKNLTKKLNFNPSQLLQFQVEPFISFVSSPHANVETGTSFLFKLGLLPATYKFQPYVKAGAGIVYMSEHTREQSTQFNFIEQGGIGMHYFWKKNTALTLEGRIRHLSNAGIKQPNHGINTYFVLAGISYQF